MNIPEFELVLPPDPSGCWCALNESDFMLHKDKVSAIALFVLTHLYRNGMKTLTINGEVVDVEELFTINLKEVESCL